ncbi:MAG: pyridoxamine 5'-phosphate oxidase family protein [Solirubrobacteraceae bacterium]
MIEFDILLDATGAVRHGAAMPSWSAFADMAPALAEQVRERLEAHPYKLIATLRRDGSPRVSGIELEFRDDGELVTGSMPGSVKARDLERDGRFALHNTPAPEPEWTGDAKLAGRAEPWAGPRDGAKYFRLELTEVSTVSLDADRTALIVEVWTPDGGVRTFTR